MFCAIFNFQTRSKDRIAMIPEQGFFGDLFDQTTYCVGTSVSTLLLTFPDRSMKFETLIKSH